MTKRRRLTKAEFKEVWERQDGLCSCGCGEPLEGNDLEEEHTIPLWLGGENGPGNVTLMIAGHQKPKTAREAKERAKGRRIRLKAKGGFGHTRKFVKQPGGKVVVNPNATGDVPW